MSTQFWRLLLLAFCFIQIFSQLFSTGDAVSFLGIPVLAADYAGSVLPIIFTVWIMSYVEPFADRISPSFIKFFTKPMLVFLIMGPLALVVIGPFGTLLNDLIAMGAEWINGKAAWLIPFLMGGLHHFGGYGYSLGNDANRYYAIEQYGF